MAKITGRVEIYVNGELMLNKEGAVASGVGVSGEQAFERVAVMGDTGLHGYKEEPRVAQLEVTVSDRGDISLSDLAGINGDGTVVFRSARGGKVYTMFNATSHKNFSITAGEGETPLVFSGPSWTETVSTS